VVKSALVLTAGLGTRLDPITRLIAKPAAPMGGRTLVERVLAWLSRQGIDDVVLNLHHRPETITGVLGDGAHLGMRVRYSWEQPVLGSAGGPRHALPLLDGETFLVVNGDTLCDVPLGPLLDAHRRTGAAATMTLIPNPAPDRYNGVVLDDADRVRRFVPRGQADGTWHFVGVQVVERRLFAPLPDGVPSETVAGLYRDLVDRQPGEVRGWRADATFFDVGTPSEYLRTALSLVRSPRELIETGASIDRRADVADSVVWREASVGANAHLRHCIVAGPVVVPPDYRGDSSLLLPASCVRPGDAARITDGVAAFPIRS
jgi:mannose-1-phosphate guanylyltransferase